MGRTATHSSASCAMSSTSSPACWTATTTSVPAASGAVPTTDVSPARCVASSNRQQSVVKGNNGLPPVDRLLQFLVDSSSDSEEAVRCANCDQECHKQDAETTYFCNTCGQPLCAHCRDETHKAKMFSCHEIVALSKRTMDIHKKCSLHSEPYIMFSTDKKSMVCIRCFRDMHGESRAHCIDIETAYLQGCEKLDQAVLAVKALQAATLEAIALLQAMLEEVRRSAAEEEGDIHALFSSMQEKLAERKTLLLKAVQTQHEEKEKAFKDQLSHLASLLPTLQVHLVTCSAFLSSANKAEFLDLGYELMERLQGIVTRPHRLRPAQSSKITSDHRAEFARCLEPLLLLSPRRAAGSGGNATFPRPGRLFRLCPGQRGRTLTRWGRGSAVLLTGTSWTPAGDRSITAMATLPSLDRLSRGPGAKALVRPGCLSSCGKMSGSPVRKPTLHRYISTKVLLAEGGDTPFTEHCRNYENAYRSLQSEIQNLKDQVQELHRDLTKHHSLIKAEIMSDILQKSLQVDKQIASEYSSVEMMRSIFEETWEETYQRVANEQEIYEAQLHDLLQLKQENSYLTTITKQITPYVRSIAKVKERLEPRFQEPTDEQPETLPKIYDDSLIVSETQPRNDPLRSSGDTDKVLESREDNHTLNILPEETFLKNKDYYKHKPKSGVTVPTQKEFTL
ncbi:RING finger protein 207 isoform X2 [Tachyglossus aculeatus]|uniref:RING finger protein 207 isoform X2 n=1 Tax=Tachyglossus aculeatus TaxID=9261 RepID=UPI0018F2BC0D|nr:RING finger protein 207 isoform X2 [Tachyglossus aculeatus]